MNKERKKNKELKEILNYYKNDNEKYEKSMLNQFNKEQLETTFHKNYQRYKNHKVLLDYIIDLQDRIDKIKINNQRIIDYGFDYDGFNNVEDLKKLIDMLVDYAKQNDKLLEEIE